MYSLKNKIINLIIVSFFVLTTFMASGNYEAKALYVEDRAIEKDNNDLGFADLPIAEGIRYEVRAKTYIELVAEGPTLDSVIEKTPVEIEEVDEVELAIEERIKNACDEYGVSFDVVLAIARLETGWFTSYAYVYGNNPGGLCYGGVPMSFETIDEGVDRFVSNLADNYFAVGLNTPETIGPRYCPGSQHWIDQVRSLMSYEW